jgi:hypothetical protein
MENMKDFFLRLYFLSKSRILFLALSLVGYSDLTTSSTDRSSSLTLKVAQVTRLISSFPMSITGQEGFCKAQGL